MLNIKEDQSKNVIDIVGTLSELAIEKKSSNGKDFIVGKATIKVDQDINGIMRECEIPVEMYANKITKEGKESSLYHIIEKYEESLVSLAGAPSDHPEMASKVTVKGATVSENVWWDSSKNRAVSTIRINSNFINPYRGSATDFEPKATFELVGVITQKIAETKNDEPTGRMKVMLATVGYNGKVDVIELIAESEGAVNFIDSNYENGDTVQLTGCVNISHKKEVYYEKQGFGPDLKKERTVACREFIITGGSPAGFDEDSSYDHNDIKAGLAERQNRVEESKNKTKSTPAAAPSKKSDPFGW